ncbi:MAG: FKBP-type peptidyl-prolyl cis-trans isomerase [Polyangiales bacterium]
MKITRGSVVRMEYELRVRDGDVLESSKKSGPIQYVHGEGKLLPALEKRLEGLAAGQKLEGTIPSAEVSPPEDGLPTKKIPRAEFAKDVALEVGEMFAATTANGATINLRIVAVDDKHVTVRMLPPIAGKDILFSVKVIEIRDPNTGKLEAVVRKPPPRVVEAKDIDLEPAD